MQIFTKSLKLSIIPLGLMQIGNTMQQQLYNYNNDIRPTVEQYCTYKNVLPITFNNLYNTKAVFNFLKEHQFQDKELLEELLLKIYNFANYLSCNKCTHWGNLDNVIDSYWETEWSWGHHAARDYNNIAPTEPTENTKTNLFKTVKIDIQSINEIISMIQGLQNQLNPERYNNTNPLSNYQSSNIMELLYYISNLWVQTTQDIIYVINKEINNSNGNRIQVKNKIIQPCYDVLEFTIQAINHLFKNNVFLLHNMEKNENTKKFRNTVQKTLNHLLRQNDLNLNLEDFKKNYLDKYSVNAAYYNSLLKKNIFEKEEQIIDKIERYKEKFQERTNELENNKNIIKKNKDSKQPFEYYLFTEIRSELSCPHFKYERALKKNIESLQKELNELNNKNTINNNTINNPNDTINEINNNINTISNNIINNINKINNNTVNKSDNNINKELEILNKYNEKFIKESNEYLANMLKNTNSCIERLIKYYSKIDNKELAQYRQEQLKYYENEIKELKDFIQNELTINQNNNKIPNINYSENIQQLLKAYTE